MIDRFNDYTAAMRYRGGGAITWVIGTVTALVGLGFALSGSGLGAVLLIGGLLLRIEAAVIRNGGEPTDTDDEPPQRPWQRDE